MKLHYKKLEKLVPLVIYKLLIFLGILFIMDFSIGRIIKHYYNKVNAGYLHRTTYAMDSTIAEMVIVGSSYANHHYKPEPFEKRLGLSFYNAGRDANHIFYHYAILKGLLKRYSPKIIILDFNFAGFAQDESAYETMSSLLPYYELHPEIRSIIELRGPFEKYKLISKIYPYNSLIFTIASVNLGYNKTDRDRNDIEGYIPLDRISKHSIGTDTLPIKYELDSNKINTFESFIKDCQAAKVTLYITASPRSIKYKYKDPSLVLVAKIAKKYNVPFINFFSDPEIIQNTQLFADQSHLNNTGAEVFSNRVIDEILKTKTSTISNSSQN